MFKFFKNIKNLFIDIKNKREFRKEMKREASDVASKFNAYKLSLDPDCNHISTIVNVPTEFQISGSDVDIMNKLQEIVRPITNYLCYELSWAEFMYVPEFYHIEDSETTSPRESRTYLVIWKYAPLIMDNKKFLTTLILSIIGLITLIGFGVSLILSIL